MSKRPDAWMPFYIGDYLRDTSRLTTEGHGAYMLLIFDYWVSGKPLPDDDHQLAAITRLSVQKWKVIRPTLAGFFRVGEGVWHHKRIDEELATATDNIDKRSTAGKTGAAARWGKRNPIANGNRIANASDKQSDGSPIANAPSPTSSLRSEVSDASASGGEPPSKPPDPVKQIYDRGIRILGEGRRALLGKMVKQYTAPVVLAAIVETENEMPVEPASYFIGCCEQRAKANGYAKQSAVDALRRGGARAAASVILRERSLADCGLGDAPAGPLLDGGG